jgi:outer membrane protein assembly factor BamE (lipoprotein component of BamABCDE complex)
MRRLIVLPALLAVLGCFHHGIEVTPEQRAALVEGKTTRDEIVQAWGKPSITREKSDGTHELIYARFYHQGGFFRSHDSREDVVLTFGAEGKLLRWRESKYIIE